jgi:glyoxylase-like metal-dependent hydrolase (beta-lactamase superfamily II)
MEAYICRTCGVQQAASESPPAGCAICDDERQYVPPAGQVWATLAELRAEGRRIQVRDLEPRLSGIGADPQIGIGQRALLVQTPGGNVLWDCLGFIDDAGIAAVRTRGGLHAIAMSHPHFYGVCVEWSHAFGGAPIYIPTADRQWVMRPDPVIRNWEGTIEPLPGVTLIQCGGHFEGSAVLHWADGAEGRGALLTGDSITVVSDRRFVSFMRSYPNDIPLPAAMVRQIVAAVTPYRFDRIYGGWWDRVVDRDGPAAIQRSADRYIGWISPPP